MNVTETLDRIRFVTPTIHGLGDYPTGAALIAAPHLFGFADAGPAAMIPRVAGALVLGQAAMTRYPTGVVRKLPMRAHLAMDMLMGPLLALSPFLLGFGPRPRRKLFGLKLPRRSNGLQQWLPHVIFGSAIALWALLTRTRSRHDQDYEADYSAYGSQEMTTGQRYEPGTREPLGAGRQM
jgi:hypothetical protein